MGNKYTSSPTTHVHIDISTAVDCIYRIYFIYREQDSPGCDGRGRGSGEDGELRTAVEGEGIEN